MITKELLTKKYCCFYASDFHLEMILLPYIKENLGKTKILILTQNDLSESIIQVLDRTNFADKQKQEILNLNWSNQELNLLDIKNEDIIIINGDKNYIENINNKIQSLKLKNIILINCYDISKIEKNEFDLTKDYQGVLNTNYITK